jgi:hypothetical protein
MQRRPAADDAGFHMQWSGGVVIMWSDGWAGWNVECNVEIALRDEERSDSAEYT